MIIYQEDSLTLAARTADLWRCVPAVRTPKNAGSNCPAEFEMWGDKRKMNPKHGELLESYARDFSEIMGLQQAHRIGYALYSRSGGLGVVVSRDSGPGVLRSAGCLLRGASEEFGRGLLRFLYENAIPPENACDVIRDVCEVEGDCAV